MMHTRTRNVLRYALILQVLLWLLAPGAASAASAPPAEPAAPQPMQLEQPTLAGTEPATTASLLSEEDLRIEAGGAQSAPLPQPSTTLTVAILSTVRTLYNTSFSAPGVFVVQAVMTNTGSVPASLPALELDFNDDPVSGWTLMPGEYPIRTPATDLAPGEAFYGYWFARHPTTTVSSHQYTVTASAQNAAPVSTSENGYGDPLPNETVVSEGALRTGSTGQLSASTEVIVGVAFTVSLQYGLSPTPEELILSPVGNVDFDASAYRLVASEVRFWENGQAITYTDRLYFPDPPSYGSNMEVIYTFVPIKPANVSICPYAGTRDSINLKYDKYYCSAADGTQISIEGDLSLSMSKQVDSETVQQSQVLTYTIDITNTGNYILGNAWIWDQLDPSLGSILAHSPDIDTVESDIDSGLVAWALPWIGPDYTRTFTITFLVDGDGADIPDGTAVVNTAYFGINPGDLPPEPALTSAVTSALEAPWIELTKSDGRTEANPGDVLTYTVHVANTGSVPARNLVITDVLPEGVSYVDGSASSPEDSRDGQTLVWTSISELGPGADATIEISVTVDPQAQDGDRLLNTVDATYENDLAWAFTRQDTDTTTVVAEGFIDGYAFGDLDGDGLRGVLEPGIGGVTVTLDSPIDGLLAQETEAVSGYYRFRLTAQQPVTVSAALPDGYFRTTPGTVYHDATLWVTQTIHFGYAPTTSTFASVYGTVYEDVDHDGVYESGEDGLSGVELQSSEALTSTVFTNDLGQYTFRYDASGTVTVTEVNPAGYVSTTPDEVQTAVVTGTSGPAIDFGDFSGIKITGQVFDDLNVNGANDDEPGIAGVSVAAAATVATTGGDGAYTHYLALSDDSPITVEETDLVGYRSTNAIGRPSSLVTRLDANRLRIDSPVAGTEYYGDFGDVQASDVVTITGRVWNDDGADGVYDDVGLAGAVVGITDGMTQTTGADGWFVLYAQPSDAIVLSEANPPGYASTEAIPGDNALKIDNDTLLISLPEAGSTSELNLFGDAPVGATAVITGVVYDDADENGVFGPGEVGLPGVTVTLEIFGGRTVVVQTNATGGYQFAVAPGQHVRITSAGPGGAYAPTTLGMTGLKLKPNHGTAGPVGARL